LLPLCENVHPRAHVKLKVVTGRTAPAKKWCDGQSADAG
jgi:hypothetical protein